ncbi:hydroxymethylglutaryl-CoA lyase [Parahaliea maris]|uniref:hydroxymethylglutaryl-CoA lyase n=1 Tax=Parahaliea maris TaxID=2716870 RepID=A0A5C8ZS54_9GAMM|nr:hydroxymethylglutaryl-CoA lyase [Parahaliea maris]TXS91276.1 hydroxymethylglutaryl-CoA lyase [Parahaliea maris]
MALPARVRVVEVGPRDGLQNEKKPVATSSKIELIRRLVDSGLVYVEAGSFVNPKWVPQMADSEAVFGSLERKPGVVYAALTPNLQGFERAMEAQADEVAIFGSASESFSQKNINCSVEESIARFKPVVKAAQDAGVRVRGYVSCVVGCPYEGKIAPEPVRQVSEALLELGCYEVSLGDTIGVGTPRDFETLLEGLLPSIAADYLAVHCHDTYGMAIANILTSLQMGIAVVDSSVAGLGGCPYAKGATGNVATEDVVYLLDGLGIAHGIDLPKLVATGSFISDLLGRPNNSKVGSALSVRSA